jgi:DNA-binding MarR family transcriptional regulator
VPQNETAHHSRQELPMTGSAVDADPVDPLDRPAAIGSIEQQMGSLQARIRASAAEAARRLHPELGTGAYPILLRISDAGPCRITDLAGYFEVGKPTMSRQVASLERLGLVDRAVDPNDGRGALVSLSSIGQEAFDAARTRRHDWFLERTASFSDAELTQFAVLLERFLSAP